MNPMFLPPYFHRPVRACWVPPDTPCTVAGFVVPGGMVYVGEELRAVVGRGVEPALISPALPVDSVAPSRVFRWTPDIPGYAAVSPKVKALYLQWLAEGRRAPQTSTGCLMLFLFGLERRVLYDRLQPDQQEAVHRELPALEAELVRLQQRYGREHPEVDQQITRLRTYLAAVRDPKADRGVLAAVLDYPASADGVSAALMLQLGQRAVAGQPVPAELAYAWYAESPLLSKREPFRQLPDLHRRLFLADYPRWCEAGLEFEGRFARIAVAYSPASPSFAGQAQEALLHLPDVSAAPAPLRLLGRLVQECDSQLDSYLRWTQRHPGRRHGLPALARLPRTLWPEALRRVGDALRQRVENSPAPLALRAAEVWSGLPAALGADAGVEGLEAWLARLGLGVEPSWNEDPAPQDWCVLYCVGEAERELTLAGEYELAQLGCRLVHRSYQQDRLPLPRDVVLDKLVRGYWTALTPSEHLRLRAYRTWLGLPGVVVPQRDLKDLPAKSKRMLAGFLTRVAEQEVLAGNTLTELATLLTPPRQRRQHGAQAPVTVLAPEGGAGFAILPSAPEERNPEAPPPAPPLVQLDAAKIARLQDETRTVSALLGAIFTEAPETPPAPAPAVAASLPTTQLLGLDPVHAGFARRVLGQPVWSRSELLALAVEHGLLLDGALERINDAAYDQFDSPLLDGADPVSIDTFIAKELSSCPSSNPGNGTP